MMTALAERDGRTVSEVIRDLVRVAYSIKFGGCTPVTDPETSRGYVWERREDQYSLHLATTPNIEITTPQATLVRAGRTFRVQHLSRDMPSALAKQLAQLAGIEIV